jgi:hypothetical protein
MENLRAKLLSLRDNLEFTLQEICREGNANKNVCSPLCCLMLHQTRKEMRELFKRYPFIHNEDKSRILEYLDYVKRYCGSKCKESRGYLVRAKKCMDFLLEWYTRPASK